MFASSTRFRCKLGHDFLVSRLDLTSRFYVAGRAKVLSWFYCTGEVRFRCGGLDVTISDSKNDDECDGDGGLRTTGFWFREGGAFSVLCAFFSLNRL
uniref:Uncharacterized protein n=2 Tax=Ficus carica TaxID=3494 RepID=A0AA88EDQ4_FICCA|nr:hypothetical protein TIFTF001_054055 [Ficus carica]